MSVLINALGDSDNAVNNVVIKSLTKIANVHPNEVIEIFCEFYRNTVKSNVTQLGNIVKYVFSFYLETPSSSHQHADCRCPPRISSIILNLPHLILSFPHSSTSHHLLLIIGRNRTLGISSSTGLSLCDKTVLLTAYGMGY